jgi:hypothetical protein
MTENFDLFGLPIPVGRGKAGRPEHVPSVEMRNKVKVLLAAGWPNDRIAKTLRLSLPTFRKHYFLELKERDAMRDRLDARWLMKLVELGIEGDNVQALKELRRFMEFNDAMRSERRLEAPVSDKQKSPKLGKKEQAIVDAGTAHVGSSWGELLDEKAKVMN